MWQLWLQVLPVILLLALGYGVGGGGARRPVESLEARGPPYSDNNLNNQKQAVIATDYFKSFAAKLRNIVGGELRAYETLLARARREAALRMLAQARRLGAGEVYNVRYETSNIRNASRRNNLGVSVEVFAFGTAVVRH